MPNRAPYQYLPTDVLERQKRTETAASWAQQQRAEVAQRWAQVHAQDAEDTLGPILDQPPPMPPSMEGVYQPEPEPAAEPAPVDRALALLEEPALAEDGGAVGRTWDDGGAVGGSWSPDPVERAGLGQRPGAPLPDFPIPDAVGRGVGAIETVRGGIDEATEPVRDWGDRARDETIDRQVALTGQPRVDAAREYDQTLDLATSFSGEPLSVVRGLGRGASRLGQAGLSLEVTGGPGDALEGAAKKAGDEVARLRLDKFPEETRDTLAAAAERGDFWRQQRRNVISDAESERMADELGRTVEEVVSGGKAGRAYNAEETRAIRNAVVGQALVVDDLRATRDALGDGASDALRRQLGEEEAKLLALSRVVEGARAEAGRAFRAYVTDTRGRLLRSRQPQYTNASSVPIRPAPELEGRVVQPRFEGPPEHRLGQGEVGPVAPPLAGQADQGTLLDPYAHYRGPSDPGRAAPELGPGATQATPFGPVDYLRPPVEPGAAAPPLREWGDPPAAQGTLIDPYAHYPEYGLVPPQTKAPPSSTPRVTEQLPLITEPVAGKPREGFKERVYDRGSLVRIAGMLSGTPTHLLNIAGNTVQGVGTLALKEGQIAADLARVGIGKALGKDVQRQRFQAEVGPQVLGYAKGWWAGAEQVPGILAHGAPQDFHKLYGTRNLESGSKVVDAAVEMPLRALAASDAVFRSAAFGGHAAALAVRQATQEGLSGAARTRRAQEILGNLSDHPGLLESANKLAARDVFQEARAGTEAIAQFKRAHTGAEVALDVVLPFYKTPYNVAAQGAGMTPAGYASALQAARNGETGEAVDRVVRATVGTMALGLGLHLASSNLLTGAYPATESERSTLPEGWKPYSLRIPKGDGAVYVPIQALGAAAVPLGTAAVMVDARRRGVEKDDPMKAAYAAVGGIGQFMGDMSALQGLNSVMKLVTEPERQAERFGESFTASMVPGSSLARQVQQAFGDAQRDPSNPVQAFMAGVPGLSQYVPEKQTPLGGTRERGPAGPVALVSGSRIGVERPNSVTAALREAKVGIPEPPKQVSRGTIKNVPLTEAEQRAYRTAAGEEISQRVQRYVEHEAWGRATPEVRAKKLEEAIRTAREAAEKEILGRIGAEEARRRVARRPAA